METLLSFSLLFVLGVALGYKFRDLEDSVNILKSKIATKPPEVGITPGAYGRTNEYSVNQPGETGLVSSKTPQQMAFEEDEAIRAMQNRVKR